MARSRKDVKVVTDGGPSHELLLELSKDIENMMTIADIDEEIFVPTFFSTSLNRCTGIGGWPLRRVVMIHGPPGAGKSVLALGIAESLRRYGHIPVIYDPEHAAEKRWYNELAFGAGALFEMPKNYDAVVNDTQLLFERMQSKRDGKGGKKFKEIGFCVVVDTLTKLMPEEAIAKIKKEGIKRAYQIAAQWTSVWMKIMCPLLYRTNSVLILVVQERAKQDRQGKFDKKNEPTGGEAIKFDNSLRVNVTHRTSIKRGDEVVGAEHHFKVVKNKVDGVHMSQGSFFTSNGRGKLPVGFDLVAEAVEEAKRRGCAKIGKNDEDEQVVRIKIGDHKREVVGGWETVREKCRDDEEWFGEFVGALNIDARRE